MAVVIDRFREFFLEAEELKGVIGRLSLPDDLFNKRKQLLAKIESVALQLLDRGMDDLISASKGYPGDMKVLQTLYEDLHLKVGGIDALKELQMTRINMITPMERESLASWKRSVSVAMGAIVENCMRYMGAASEDKPTHQAGVLRAISDLKTVMLFSLIFSWAQKQPCAIFRVFKQISAMRDPEATYGEAMRVITPESAEYRAILKAGYNLLHPVGKDPQGSVDDRALALSWISA